MLCRSNAENVILKLDFQTQKIFRDKLNHAMSPNIPPMTHNHPQWPSTIPNGQQSPMALNNPQWPTTNQTIAPMSLNDANIIPNSLRHHHISFSLSLPGHHVELNSLSEDSSYTNGYILIDDNKFTSFHDNSIKITSMTCKLITILPALVA